jgi:hypothetical protein
VEELSDRLDRNAAIALLLPRSRIVSRQRHEFGSYSFLRLIAVVGELMKAGTAGDERVVRESISRILFDATQARSYPTPSADGTTDADASNGEVDDDEDHIDADILRPEPDVEYDGPIDLEELIGTWLSDHAHADVAVAPVTLSRMWTRLDERPVRAPRRRDPLPRHPDA